MFGYDPTLANLTSNRFVLLNMYFEAPSGIVTLDFALSVYTLPGRSNSCPNGDIMSSLHGSFVHLRE